MKNFFRAFNSLIQYFIIFILFFGIYAEARSSNSGIIPIQRLKEGIDYTTINNLRYLKAPEKQIIELNETINEISNLTKKDKYPIDKELIIALIKTESNFKMKARSEKNYQGLMQTPNATFEYADVDVLHGVRILQDKMVITNGNILHALTLYKGGNNPAARRYAKETYSLYIKLLERKILKS